MLKGNFYEKFCFGSLIIVRLGISAGVVLSLIFSFVVFPSIRGLAAADDLDAAFGTGGLVTTNVVRRSRMLDIAIQPDGKIVAVGGTILANEDVHSRNTDRSFYAVVRYNASGLLDTTFNGDGKFLVGFHGAGDEQAAVAVAVQPDGKIVFAGTGAPTSRESIEVFRLNSDGSLDRSFDANGYKVIVVPNMDALPAGIVLQPDGKIVISGFADGNPMLVRLNANGSYDTSFDGDGTAISDLGVYIQLTAMALQTDGRIVITGIAPRSEPGNGTDLFAARYNTDGSLDTGFDSDGWLISDWGSTEIPTAIGIQNSGKIVVTGNAITSSIGVPAIYSILLTRFNSDGSLDTLFGGDGHILFDGAQSLDMTIDQAGRIVIAGQPDIYQSQFFGVLRFNADGSIDTSFSNDGIVSTQFSPVPDVASASCMAIQADAKIVVGGNNGTPRNADFALARYLAQ